MSSAAGGLINRLFARWRVKDTRHTFFIMRFGHASAQNGGSSISSLWLSIVLGAAAHVYILGLFKAKLAWGQQHALSSS
jgi:hypothetical protein